MRSTILAVLIISLSLCFVNAQDAATPPITRAEALKLGPEGIAAKLQDESENGLDGAALFYAVAKRLQTESELGEKSLLSVLDLDNWRQVIKEWNDAWYEGMYIVSGGGTMWGHMQMRGEADREDMLAELAGRLPFVPGNASAETLSKWGTVEEAIIKATVPSDSDPEVKAQWKTHQEVMKQKWERLNFEFQAINDNDAQLILEHILPDAEQLAAFLGK